MLIDFFSNLLFGRHSEAARRFEASLKRDDTKTCLQILTEMPSFVHSVERDVSGHDTPLHMAVRHGNHEVCDRLLSLGADMDVIREHDGQRASPMMTVATAPYDFAPNAQRVRQVFLKHYIERQGIARPSQGGSKRASVFKTLATKLLAAIQDPVHPVLTPQATIEYFEAARLPQQRQSALTPGILPLHERTRSFNPGCDGGHHSPVAVVSPRDERRKCVDLRP